MQGGLSKSFKVIKVVSEDARIRTHVAPQMLEHLLTSAIAP